MTKPPEQNMERGSSDPGDKNMNQWMNRLEAHSDSSFCDVYFPQILKVKNAKNEKQFSAPVSNWYLIFHIFGAPASGLS